MKSNFRLDDNFIIYFIELERRMESKQLADILAKLEALSEGLAGVRGEVEQGLAGVRGEVVQVEQGLESLREEVKSVRGDVSERVEGVRWEVKSVRGDMAERLDVVSVNVAKVSKELELQAKFTLEVAMMHFNAYQNMSETSASRIEFLASNIKTDFGIADAKCALTGHKRGVILAHILPRSAKQHIREMLGIFDAELLNGPRNLIFLCENIEKKFDRLQLSFVTEMRGPPLREALVMKIWDDNIRDVPIYPGSSFTIGSYENQELDLNTGGSITPQYNPYRRCFAYQYLEAYLKHRKASNYAEEAANCAFSDIETFDEFRKNSIQLCQDLRKGVAREVREEGEEEE